MLLKKLIEGLKVITPEDLPDFDIESLENDSRRVNKKSLFIAYSGYTEDAHPYIGNAYQNGCRFFIIDSKRLNDFKMQFPKAFFIGSSNLPETLSFCASRFYENPTSKLYLIGITGTSGKTTTAFTTYHLLRKMGIRAGLIGTIEYRIDDEILPASNTTPDVLFLNYLFHRMIQKGVTHCVMEVSSHALALGRVNGLEFNAVAFTNFSQDHLDFHKTMEEYLKAKLKIFNLISSSPKKEHIAIVNMDMKEFPEIINYTKNIKPLQLKTFSVEKKKADYYIKILSMSPQKSEIELCKEKIEIGMIGITNIYNFSLASIILIESGFNIKDFKKFTEEIRVPGRMESFQNDSGFTVIIDYAHKPDALEKLLKTVRSLIANNQRVITVFGCGGDRDKLKRPIMGRIAGNLSESVIITSDNPRTENPDNIILEIEQGLKENGFHNYTTEVDRKKAIHKALMEATRGDIVVIAGKGHEDYQIIGKTKIHFSDREEVEKFFKKGSI